MCLIVYYFIDLLLNLLEMLSSRFTYLFKQLASRPRALLRCSRSAEYRWNMSNGKMVTIFARFHTDQPEHTHNADQPLSPPVWSSMPLALEPAPMTRRWVRTHARYANNVFTLSMCVSFSFFETNSTFLCLGQGVGSGLLNYSHSIIVRTETKHQNTASNVCLCVTLRNVATGFPSLVGMHLARSDRTDYTDFKTCTRVPETEPTNRWGVSSVFGETWTGTTALWAMYRVADWWRWKVK